MNKKKVLLLVGSPKAERSSSFSIGKYLCEKIEGKSFQTDHAFIHRLIMRKEKQEDLIRMIKQANLIILSFPLYIDHLPSPVIRMMELLTNNKEELKAPERKAFVSICNSGFPESFQIKLATQICQNFSNAMGFQWKGGIQKGGGGLIHGSNLNEIGRMTEDMRKGLELAANDLRDGEKVSEKALELISKIPISNKLYRMMGNIGWRTQALGNGNIFNLKDQPYKE